VRVSILDISGFSIGNLMVTGYRNYYIGAKKYFAKWQKGRSVPKWFIEKTPLNV